MQMYFFSADAASKCLCQIKLTSFSYWHTHGEYSVLNLNIPEKNVSKKLIHFNFGETYAVFIIVRNFPVRNGLLGF